MMPANSSLTRPATKRCDIGKPWFHKSINIQQKTQNMSMRDYVSGNESDSILQGSFSYFPMRSKSLQL